MDEPGNGAKMKALISSPEVGVAGEAVICPRLEAAMQPFRASFKAMTFTVAIGNDIVYGRGGGQIRS